MCNGRSAQQESGAALSKEQYVYGGGQKVYTAIMPARCALIRDRQPTAWDDIVWFPDPSVMRMRGRGKKGLGTIPSHGPEAGI